MLKKRLVELGIDIPIVDVDTDSTIARQYQVRGVPTILFINDDGMEADRFTGSELSPAQFDRVRTALQQ